MITKDRKVEILLEKCSLVGGKLGECGYTEERMAEIVLPSVAMMLKDLEVELESNSGKDN